MLDGVGLKTDDLPEGTEAAGRILYSSKIHDVDSQLFVGCRVWHQELHSGLVEAIHDGPDKTWQVPSRPNNISITVVSDCCTDWE